VKSVAVAKRYARALAACVAETDPAGLDKVAADLALAAGALARDPRFLRFFADPARLDRDKESAIDALVRQAKIGEPTGNFLRLLVRNRRLSSLPAIHEAFEVIRDQRLGVVPVEATTAVPLKAEEVKRFREALEKMTRRKVRLALQVDPGVLGGVRARIGSKIYDGTLKRQLAILRERLAEAR
jgi:F-type H+-transporting ATPase subunit delta